MIEFTGAELMLALGSVALMAFVVGFMASARWHAQYMAWWFAEMKKEARRRGENVGDK